MQGGGFGQTIACQSCVGTLGFPTKTCLEPGLLSKGTHSLPGGGEGRQGREESTTGTLPTLRAKATVVPSIRVMGWNGAPTKLLGA